MVHTRTGQRKLEIAAAGAVFDIPELHEEILLGLPTKDLLLAQRALFFKPIGIHTRSDEDDYQPPILPAQPTILFNPILPGCPTPTYIRGRLCYKFKDLETTFDQISELDTSIGKMLLTQPAVTSTGLSAYKDIKETPREIMSKYYHFDIENICGIRMQDVHDRLMEVVNPKEDPTSEVTFHIKHYTYRAPICLEDNKQMEELKARLKK